MNTKSRVAVRFQYKNGAIREIKLMAREMASGRWQAGVDHQDGVTWYAVWGATSDAAMDSIAPCLVIDVAGNSLIVRVDLWRLPQ